MNVKYGKLELKREDHKEFSRGGQVILYRRRRRIYRKNKELRLLPYHNFIKILNHKTVYKKL